MDIDEIQSTPIASIKAGMNGLTIKAIIIEMKLKPTKDPRKDQIMHVTISDSSGCAIMTIFDPDIYFLLREGDIILLTNAYAKYFRNQLKIYHKEIKKVGDFCMVYNDKNNISEVNPDAELQTADQGIRVKKKEQGSDEKLTNIPQIDPIKSEMLQAADDLIKTLTKKYATPRVKQANPFQMRRRFPPANPNAPNPLPFLKNSSPSFKSPIRRSYPQQPSFDLRQQINKRKSHSPIKAPGQEGKGASVFKRVGVQKAQLFDDTERCLNLKKIIDFPK